MDASARIVPDRAVGNDQAPIDTLVADLRALEGEPVIGLDITGSLAGFLEAVPLVEGFNLVHTPGIAVNRAGHGFAGGERKSDPRDARTIADLVRTRDQRPILPDGKTVIALRLKVMRRRELLQDQTRRIARLRQLIGAVHPGLERAIELTCKGPLALLTRYVTPAEIRSVGERRLVVHLQQSAHLYGVPALVARPPGGQGPAAFAEMIRELSRVALATRDTLARLDRELEALVARQPDSTPIRSLPGMGVVLTAEFIAAVGRITRFRSADALACAAGLAPVIRQSGKTRPWRRALHGDKALKRVFFQSALCAVSTTDPLSTAFYDHKRREGKHHTQALIALARRRVIVPWTMLQRRQTFDPLKNAARLTHYSASL